MANSYGRMRTNYFRVTDPEQLKAIIAKCQGSEGEKLLLFEELIDGEQLYGFGCTASLMGYYDEESEEYDFDAFVSDLQTLVVPGDAIILMEISYAKMCYVCGTALIITNDTTKSISLTDLALEAAAKALGNPEYQTKMEY